LPSYVGQMIKGDLMRKAGSSLLTRLDLPCCCTICAMIWVAIVYLGAED
jgi:hypothetical protein